MIGNPTPGSSLDTNLRLRHPTNNNPFMNVMPTDYGNIPEYADYPRYSVRKYSNSKNLNRTVNDKFTRELFRDSDSLLFNRINSQREYISQPVGTVPSDQGNYANWLYLTNGNCKNGSIHKVHTSDSLLCTGSNAAEPTNKGLTNGHLMSSVYEEMDNDIYNERITSEYRL